MEKIFKQYNPQYPFEYKFVDETYAEKFTSEQVTGHWQDGFLSSPFLFHVLAYLDLQHIWRKTGSKKSV